MLNIAAVSLSLLGEEEEDGKEEEEGEEEEDMKWQEAVGKIWKKEQMSDEVSYQPVGVIGLRLNH